MVPVTLVTQLYLINLLARSRVLPSWLRNCVRVPRMIIFCFSKSYSPRRASTGAFFSAANKVTVWKLLQHYPHSFSLLQRCRIHKPNHDQVVAALKADSAAKSLAPSRRERSLGILLLIQQGDVTPIFPRYLRPWMQDHEFCRHTSRAHYQRLAGCIQEGKTHRWAWRLSWTTEFDCQTPCQPVVIEFNQYSWSMLSGNIKTLDESLAEIEVSPPPSLITFVPHISYSGDTIWCCCPLFYLPWKNNPRIEIRWIGYQNIMGSYPLIHTVRNYGIYTHIATRSSVSHYSILGFPWRKPIQYITLLPCILFTKSHIMAPGQNRAVVATAFYPTLPTIFLSQTTSFCSRWGPDLSNLVGKSCFLYSIALT